MKKSVIKVTLMVVLIASLFLLSSCQSGPTAGERPQETAAILKLVTTGTQGVKINLMQNLPPALLYDENELVALVEVQNKGNYDLQRQDCFIQITGFDPNIISGGFSSPRSCSENVGVLEGKNVYNTEGSTNIIEFSSNVNLPNLVTEYNPTLNFLTCYNYHTVANPSVCIDPSMYQVTSEQKTCIPGDVLMGGGQGGPVGVTYVSVDMVRDRAIFEINVRNLGSGRVLSPYANLQNCGQASLDYKDLDKVVYNVEMSSGSKISCKPMDGIVRLVDGQGKIICSFNTPQAAAFETPLSIDLDYSYVESYKKPVRIVKTPQ